MAATAAVRTFPFRVFSFPKEIETGTWRGISIAPYPGILRTPHLNGIFDLTGIAYRVDPYLPHNEIWFVREAKTQTLHVHEGPRAGADITEVIKPGQILRIIDLVPTVDRTKFLGLSRSAQKIV